MKKDKSSAPHDASDRIRDNAPPARQSRRRLNFIVAVLCILLTAMLISACSFTGNQPDHPTEITTEVVTEAPAEPATEAPTEPATEAPTELATEAPAEPLQPVAARATIAVTGDVLMHIPIINSFHDRTSGTYDFSGIFRYLSDYASAADYAIANLETTLAGSDRGYTGYPRFNCPDEITDALKSAGFDMLLTSNNHCYDTGVDGLIRTLEVVNEKGLDTLGTQLDADTTDYHIEDVNGIQVGMMCYSYATYDSNPDLPSMNGIPVASAAYGMINYFDYDRLDVFYEDVSRCIDAMKSAGADVFVLYIHWGMEYQLSPNARQEEIAQQLCDLGVDVIVGGHPHVIQPVELLTSSIDDSHKTVCLYSMGNAVSNQRKQYMDKSTGHTEDGLLFCFSFTKYMDGEVLLDTVEILPTWVYMGSAGEFGRYRILPLDTGIEDWSAAFGISDTVTKYAQKSYDRTMALVGDGLTTIRDYLTQTRKAKLTALLDAYT